jgi:Flagellar hook-length control protein FliK
MILLNKILLSGFGMTLATNQCTTGSDRINEDMTNSNISEFNAIPIDILGDKTQSPIKPGRIVQVFGPDFKEFWQMAQKMPNPATSGLTGNGKASRAGRDFYVDQLRKGLLAKGKTLSHMTIEREDFPLLKEFLAHLGFSKEKADQVIKDLAEAHPGGAIPLSLFMKHIAELDLPENASLNHPSVKPSAIPNLESALRAMGLSPKEVERVFNGTRDELGGLDLTKLTTNLKSFLHETSEGSEIGNRHVTFERVSDKLEKIGLPIPVKEKQDQISIRDLIAAWERTTGAGDKEDPLPADIKGLIDKISQNASLQKETPESLSSLMLLGKLRGEDPASTRKITGRGEPFNGVDPSEKTGPFKRVDTFKQEDPFTPPAGKESKQAIHGSQRSGSSTSGKSLESPAELKHDLGSDTGPKAENFSVQSEKATFSVLGHTRDSSFADAVQAAKKNQSSVKDVLPAQLVDRVGRQISRSLQRGDRIIRIQLKPPELGTVKVEMDLKEHVLKLGMIIENSSVKELLLANAHELREALVDQGFKLEKMDVQIGNHSNPTFGDLKEGMNGEQRGNQGGKTYLPPSEEYWTDTLPDQPVPFYRDQRLDLMA